MRYKPTDERTDNPAGVMEHAGRYAGKRALIVLGGYSARDWQDLYCEIEPDVLIGGNGANVIPDLDYWVMTENLTRSAGLARSGDFKSTRIMEMFYRETGAKNKFVSHWSWPLLKNTDNCVSIRRQGYELDELAGNFAGLRDYGMGLLAGWLLKEKAAGAGVHVGTVGLQCLHLAGILGCSEVHTIGYDLMFKNREIHHWYEYPIYEIDRFRTPKAFINYKGVQTLQAWLEAAQFLKHIEPLFKQAGLHWVDHSAGLLRVYGLDCADG